MSITEKTHAEQSSIKSVSRFSKKHRLGSALKRSGANKEKGVSATTIVQYLIALIYTRYVTQKPRKGFETG